MTEKRIGDDRGGATILASFAILALVVVAAMILQVGAVVSARHRAQSAADLAALAAAGALDRGSESACAAAQDVAGRMSVSVGSCAIEDWDATVTVRARVELSNFGVKEVEAIARAGPVESD
ncbi:Rv3654c family TadE-like protein [Antrihabitans sp. YC2-6]|uniref:Rv3654c family TadE-like protein n=1 Tax=Antrihabitans sp. YC2-6 TaxID=2799498 RepID=UPI0018F448B5|nr:Rv3654c family TadE-like protein [Antrihabitans sp. YC2-6]MBJ8346043.1 flp pilus-assembly TadE/G-like family protein [Antrihabitans sp. YC2-6]